MHYLQRLMCLEAKNVYEKINGYQLDKTNIISKISYFAVILNCKGVIEEF